MIKEYKKIKEENEGKMKEIFLRITQDPEILKIFQILESKGTEVSFDFKNHAFVLKRGKAFVEEEKEITLPQSWWEKFRGKKPQVEIKKEFSQNWENSFYIFRDLIGSYKAPSDPQSIWGAHFDSSPYPYFSYEEGDKENARQTLILYVWHLEIEIFSWKWTSSIDSNSKLGRLCAPYIRELEEIPDHFRMEVCPFKSKECFRATCTGAYPEMQVCSKVGIENGEEKFIPLYEEETSKV